MHLYRIKTTDTSEAESECDVHIMWFKTKQIVPLKSSQVNEGSTKNYTNHLLQCFLSDHKNMPAFRSSKSCIVTLLKIHQ